MKAFLDRDIAQVNEILDTTGTSTISLVAGLALARVWVTEMEPKADGWALFCQRLHTAVGYVSTAPDAGQHTQFGLWDGLKAVASRAEDIDKEPNA
jgi:hypothetical protein